LKWDWRSVELDWNFEDERGMMRVVVRNWAHVASDPSDFEISEAFVNPLAPFDDMSNFQ